MAVDSDVVIIGGGVIGCACAYHLARRGLSVTVLERGALGHGASYGNAGWIVPGHAMPLPMPGALGESLRWLTRKDSPLYIKPRADLEMARWLLRFLGFATRRHLAYAAPVLVELSRHTLEQLEQLAREHPSWPWGFRRDGLLYVCNSAAGLAASRHEMQVARDLGIPARELDEAALRALEPAVTGAVAGGVLFEAEAHAEPLQIVLGLARLAEQQGAEFATDTEVYEFICRGNRIDGLLTTRGRVAGDRYVLATGSWTPQLADMLELRVPIQPAKGYALIVRPFEPAPRRPLLLFEKKVAVTPRDDTVRLAGTLELAGMTEAINPLRVRAIARGARAYLNVPEDVEAIETWRGLRPCTPDGLPLIGTTRRCENLLLAAGHAMLGLTMCAATGHLVADLIKGDDPLVDPEPFRPDRFG